MEENDTAPSNQRRFNVDELMRGEDLEMTRLISELNVSELGREIQTADQKPSGDVVYRTVGYALPVDEQGDKVVIITPDRRIIILGSAIEGANFHNFFDANLVPCRDFGTPTTGAELVSKITMMPTFRVVATNNRPSDQEVINRGVTDAFSNAAKLLDMRRATVQATSNLAIDLGKTLFRPDSNPPPPAPPIIPSS